MKQYYNFKLFLTLCLSLGLSAAWGQTTVFDFTGEYESYIVPDGVTSINIEALGAQGASGQSGRVGGRGARMSGDFDVVPGSELIIVVGGEGQGQSSGSNGGGGGGSFVVVNDPDGDYEIDAGPFAGTTVTPLIVAGGGGGTRTSVGSDGNPGVVGDMGTSSSGSGFTGGGTPVTAPEAGGIALSSSWGSGGAGFVGDGGNDGTSGCGGDSFLNGAQGGTGCGSSGDNAAGGFGGGGQGRGSWGGGGGGGWSGGQGGRVAGGGGSYNIGMAQDNASGFQNDDGQVTIQVLCLGLTIDIPVTGVCIGEELTLMATSETGGTITWDPDVDNGVPFEPELGTFTYTAMSTSDMDCGFTVDISASEIPEVVANSSLPSACEGAEIILFGTGAGGPGEGVYTWMGDDGTEPMDSVGFTAAEGTVTYTVIGSILGCEGPPDMITLDAAPQPDAEASVEPMEICLGDSYEAVAGGDLVESTYWGGGINEGDDITPESAGTYIYTVIAVSEDGCYDTTTATGIVHAIPFVDAGDDITVCEGDEVTLTAAGAVDYTWSPTITDGEAFVPEAGETEYVVTGTDENGCSDDDGVVVTVVELPYVESADVTPEFFGFDGAIDITVAGGSGSYTFEWSHGPTTEDVTGLTSGIIYTVTIDDITIDPGMCSVSESYEIPRFIGINDASIEVLNAYPNPTTDLLTITYEGQFNYEVSNAVGQLVLTGNAVNQEQLSLKELANGTYIVKVTAGDDIKYVQVVKQ